MIDPAFRNINLLFLYSLKNGDNDPAKNQLVKYYMPLVQINNFNALIDNKSFFINSQKAKKKLMKNLPKCYNRKLIQLFVSSKLL